MEIKEKLKETGQRFSDAATELKDKLVAKLSEENAQTPEQRLKNARAEEAGAKEAEKAAKRALMEVQDEADKYKRYAESAEKKGDSSGVRKFENALAELTEKLKPLEEDYQEAAAKTAVLGEICNELEAALHEETSVNPESTASEIPQETVMLPTEPVEVQAVAVEPIQENAPEIIPEACTNHPTAEIPNPDVITPVEGE